MSGPEAPAGPSYPNEVDDFDAMLLRKVLPRLVDLSFVLAWFVVAGLIAAVIWWQVTPLAEYTRTTDNGTMDEQQLAVQVAADGWFFVVAAVGGAVSGLALMLLRFRAPVLMVVWIVAGSTLAWYLTKEIGLLLGPGDPNAALASVAVGDKVPLQLEYASKGLAFVWPTAALAGALVGLVGGEMRESSRSYHQALQQYGYGTDTGRNG
ncbi:hypothetical protein EFK50_03130 [Nocardioides marmoriginsengisoli]|uniref:DUF2567 domain-containing protein n=1 Tax=Nocardioides marmoriginsengisoli TaxID=661483 RepID=A0A3N0CPM6_9ACTN|nr:hypothetical protein [Nocardioides marmoriginsengisoli]RNL64986.1 hypothetical protein EFK50_03130 [Nocardioides marmoriginsengisoli]